MDGMVEAQDGMSAPLQRVRRGKSVTQGGGPVEVVEGRASIALSWSRPKGFRCLSRLRSVR